MVHVLASRFPDHDWFLKAKKKRFANVPKIHGNIDNAVAVTLRAIFFLTGCDTVGYLFRKSKKAILEWLLKQETLPAELPSDSITPTSQRRRKKI